ncbi:hypothetical protein [Domibacillus mangrovi]|uniref:Lipoprotein n=1 Tax=Domibacillus mangrovi TaxID=1714354 RepID=A0A1Q5P3N0_9BACI|nr:hypothetical protein [Domibacillus mangrovi]OKL36860.1 hypothetical protein BLL40_09060 [Domibacillus mangrovi]
MKRWFWAIVVVGMLSACTPNEEEFVQEFFPEETSANIEEPSEEELAELMREKAKPAVFTALNADQPQVDKKVTATGEVIRVAEPGMMGTFSLRTDEGTYTIMNLTKTEVEERSKVTIYAALI